MSLYCQIAKPLLCCLFAALLPLLGAAQQGLPIAQAGQSAYQIVIESEAAREAGEELQRYLQQATGALLPLIYTDAAKLGPVLRLRIASEETRRGPLDAGWLKLRAEGNNLLIAASDEGFLWYAIYEFLERFAGCRWLDPQSDQVPALTSLAVPAELDYHYQPPIATRTVHSRLFYDHPAFARKLRVTTEAFPYYTPDARVHTFHRFLPEAQFYQEHPEYYALRGDQRLPTQLCLSKAEVLQIVIDSVRAHFARHPEAQAISVSQDDNTQYCECPACRQSDTEEGSPAGTMLRFVNQVAAHFPDKTVTTLAYQYTRAPGKTKPAGNVMITLCSIECDRSGPIAGKCADFAADLAAWRAMGAQLRIWDYTTQFTNFLAPFPNFHTLQPNIQLFRDHGARWVFEQHSGNPSELFELRSYLMAKLLWDPELDPDSLVRDFCRHYYGPAAEPILAYLGTLHEELAKAPDFFLFLYGDPSQAFGSYLSASLLQQYSRWMDQAEALTADNDLLLGRVQRARLGVDYAELEACRKGLGPGYSLREGWLPERLQAFAQTCAENGIVLVNETGYTVEEYARDYRFTLERAQVLNLAAGKTVRLLTKPKKYAGEDPQALADGAYGGPSFYANWLGFEGNDLVAELDLGALREIASCGMAFLQVVNHIVFLPLEVEYFYAGEDRQFHSLGKLANPRPLSRESKINDLHYFKLEFPLLQARYLQVQARNLATAPYWHHGAGLPAWIFADEWVVEGRGE